VILGQLVRFLSREPGNLWGLTTWAITLMLRMFVGWFMSPRNCSAVKLTMADKDCLTCSEGFYLIDSKN
jgi:hypothetical protein